MAFWGLLLSWEMWGSACMQAEVPGAGTAEAARGVKESEWGASVRVGTSCSPGRLLWAECDVTCFTFMNYLDPHNF